MRVLSEDRGRLGRKMLTDLSAEFAKKIKNPIWGPE